MKIKETFLKHFWHETWYKRYWGYLVEVLHHHFIPHPGNNHLPHALHPKYLKVYAAILILVKVVLTALLFTVYPSYSVFSAKITDDVISLTNQARQEIGAGVLKTNDLLTEAAQAKANDMIARGYFSHTSPDGDKPWVWLDKYEYPYVYAGENLAMSFSSAESVEQAFMDSPTHRKNILNPKYNEIGVAVAYGKMDGKETAVLVEFFGSTSQYGSMLTMSGLDKQVDKYEADITNKNDVKTAGSLVVSAKNPYDISQSTGKTIEGDTLSKTEEDNAPVVVAVHETNQARDIINRAILLVDNFFYAFLIFLSFALLLKIFIQIRVQHPHVIGYTATLIVLIAVLLMTQVHFLERIINQTMSIF